MSLLVYAVGFVGVVLGAGVGITLARMLGVRVRRRVEPRPTCPEDVPAPIHEALCRAGEALEELGFARVGALAEDCLVDRVDEPTWSLVYCDVTSTSFAKLSLAESPTRHRPVELALYSFRSTGELQETVSWRAHRAPEGLPGHVLIDAHTLSFAGQWNVHRQATATAGTTPEPVDFDTFVTRMRAFSKRAHERELAEGRYVERGDGTLRFSLRGALATMARTNRGERERLKALAAHAPDHGGDGVEPRAADEIALAPDVAAHRRRESVERHRTTGWPAKAGLLLGSLVLFALVFGIQLSPEALGWLILALFFHELGHAVAMWCLGYRDLQILFVPLFGAVVSGRKEDVAPWQEVLVLLAGPAPGLVLGTLLLTSSVVPPESGIREGAAIMLLVNYLNLLPIVPLDGGRLLSVVLFERVPIAQWAFGALGGVAALALGVRLGEPFLICFGGALLLVLPRQLAHARVFARVRDRLAAPARREADLDPLQSVYAELRAPRFDRWNSEARFQFVRQILERLERRKGTATLAVASLAAYTVVAVLPLGYLRYGPNPLVPPEADSTSVTTDADESADAPRRHSTERAGGEISGPAARQLASSEPAERTARPR